MTHTVSEKLIYAIPLAKKKKHTSIELSKTLEVVLQKGVSDDNPSVTQKWKNTLEFYTYVINNNY
ncbi:MAG: hypothetical protein WAM14_11725 [Candidatus Nitrosopolaris sp.]